MSLPQKEGTLLNYLYQGLIVDIVLKQDQKTMTLTRGKIQSFLTSKPRHPRGIKVVLERGSVKRLYHSSPKSKIRDVTYDGTNPDEDFIGRVQRVHYPSQLGLLILNANGGPIDKDLYTHFISCYKEHNIYLLNENNIDISQFKNYISKVKEDIDIVLYENVKQLFFDNLYSLVNDLDKKIDIYTLKENKSLIHLISGLEKKVYFK